MKILLGERSSAMRTVHVECFVQCGVSPDQVISVQDGLELLTVLEPGQFGLVLVDWQLPLLNAKELANQIRTIDPHVPIIGLMTPLEHLRQRISEVSGMSDVLVKPFSSIELRGVLNRWMLTVTGT